MDDERIDVVTYLPEPEPLELERESICPDPVTDDEGADPILPETAIKPSDQWATPNELILSLQAKLGIEFGLDVCAAPHNAVCHEFLGHVPWVEGGFIDGLKAPWVIRGKGPQHVWCNPPYSNVDPWVDKALMELSLGRVRSATFLLNLDPTTKWYGKLWEADDFSVRALHLAPRVPFLDVTGTSPAGNRYPSAVFSLRPKSFLENATDRIFGGSRVVERFVWREGRKRRAKRSES